MLKVDVTLQEEEKNCFLVSYSLMCGIQEKERKEGYKDLFLYLLALKETCEELGYDLRIIETDESKAILDKLSVEATRELRETKETKEL